MNTVHIKLAAVITSLAQIVPEYDPSKVVLSEENRFSLPVIALAAFASAVLIGFVIIAARRRRKKRRYIGR